MFVFLWLGFIVLISLLLALDLGVFNKKDHTFSAKEALGWSAFWIFLGMLFSVFIYFAYGNNWLDIQNSAPATLAPGDATLKYITGYLIEKSLSLDNIFIIALIFESLRIPSQYQHRVLFWGILGAIVLRGIMIFAGAIFVQKFTWLIYVFGLLLLATALRMLFRGEHHTDPRQSRMYKWTSKLYPLTEQYDGHRFFINLQGVRHATPLFLALVLVESSDVLFAVDSIPAIFAITLDPFIIFTSNIFAILGLRSLYFALAWLINRFYYLRQTLVIILLYISIKMLISPLYHISIWISLLVIVFALAGGILFSVFKARRMQKEETK